MSESTTKTRQKELRAKNRQNSEVYREVVEKAKANHGTIVIGEGTTAQHFRTKEATEQGDTLTASLTVFHHNERSRLGEVEYLIRWRAVDEEMTERSEEFAKKRGKDVEKMYEEGILPTGEMKHESFDSYAAAIRRFGEIIPDSAEAKYVSEL